MRKDISRIRPSFDRFTLLLYVLLLPGYFSIAQADRPLPHSAPRSPASNSQSPAANFQLPAADRRLLGTKAPYPAIVPAYTLPPAGFHPVFINYAGRHGARFMTKPGSDREALALLEEAEENHALTPLGQSIKAMTERFLSIETGNYESITILGQEEQKAIGERMLLQYGNAFRGKGLEIVMTYKRRTQQSADAFLLSFGTYKGPKTTRIVPDSLDNAMRFYDLSPAYGAFKKSPAIKKSMDSLYKDPRTETAAEKICRRIFTPSFAARLDRESAAGPFSLNLYDLYCSRASIPGEMQRRGFTKDSIDFGMAFRPDDLAWLAFLNNAEDFLEKGPGKDTLGLQVRIAAPLLVDFINSTQAIIKGARKEDAILRFTHAEAISPFATLLGIPLASRQAGSVFRYGQGWRADRIIPLSANIQWILYTNGKEYLVKVLLNEQETRLPFPSFSGPYYKWEKLETYYRDKLRKDLHTGPEEDMHAYLLEVK